VDTNSPSHQKAKFFLTLDTRILPEIAQRIKKEGIAIRSTHNEDQGYYSIRREDSNLDPNKSFSCKHATSQIFNGKQQFPKKLNSK
jgi:hypothetical protein